MAKSYTQLEEEYQQFQRERPNLSEIRRRLEEEKGLPQKREEINRAAKAVLDARSLLDAIPTNVRNRSRQLGAPVTQAVMDRLTAAAQRPVYEDMETAQRGEQMARVGSQELENMIMTELGLIASQRQQEDADWIRRLNKAYTSEENAKNRAGSGGLPFGDINSFLNLLNDTAPRGDAITQTRNATLNALNLMRNNMRRNNMATPNRQASSGTSRSALNRAISLLNKLRK